MILPRPGQRAHLDHVEAHPSAADDHHAAPDGHLGPVDDGTHGSADPAPYEAHLVQPDITADLDRAALRHDGILGEGRNIGEVVNHPSVTADAARAIEKEPRPAIGACGVPARGAGSALTATGEHIDQNVVPLGDFGHPGSHAFDDSRGLVAGNDRDPEGGHVPFLGMAVGAAHTGSRDLNEDLPGLRVSQVDRIQSQWVVVLVDDRRPDLQQGFFLSATTTAVGSAAGPLIATRGQVGRTIQSAGPSGQSSPGLPKSSPRLTPRGPAPTLAI